MQKYFKNISKNIYIEALKLGKLISEHSELFCQIYFPCIDSKNRFMIEIITLFTSVKLGDSRKQNKLYNKV